MVKSVLRRSATPAGCCTKARGWPSGCMPPSGCSNEQPTALLPVTRAIIERGRSLQRARCLSRAIRTGGVSSRSRTRVRRDRLPAAADHRHDLRDRRNRRRPGAAQQQSRAIYQFREFARSVGNRPARRFSPKRAALRNFAVGAGFWRGVPCSISARDSERSAICPRPAAGRCEVDAHFLCDASSMIILRLQDKTIFLLRCNISCG